MAEEGEFDLGIVERWKKVENFCYFSDTSANDITGEWDVANGCAKEMKSGGGSARYSPAERVCDVDLLRKPVAAPNQGLLRVKMKPNIRSETNEEVKDDLEVLTPTDEGAVVEEKDE